MSKKTTYYYVLVATTEGAKFVTSIEGRNMAKWDKTATPMEMSREMAKDMVIGLTWNGCVAFVVAQPFPLDHQPHQYDKGVFTWSETTN